MITPEDIASVYQNTTEIYEANKTELARVCNEHLARLCPTFSNFSFKAYQCLRRLSDRMETVATPGYHGSLCDKAFRLTLKVYRKQSAKKSSPKSPK